jgi:hypothetical protein
VCAHTNKKIPETIARDVISITLVAAQALRVCDACCILFMQSNFVQTVARNMLQGFAGCASAAILRCSTAKKVAQGVWSRSRGLQHTFCVSETNKAMATMPCE